MVNIALLAAKAATTLKAITLGSVGDTSIANTDSQVVIIGTAINSNQSTYR
jgi:hypothetical protein